MLNSIVKYHAATGPKKWILWLVVSAMVLGVVIYRHMQARAKALHVRKLRDELDKLVLQNENKQRDILREGDITKLTQMYGESAVLKKEARKKSLEITAAELAYKEELDKVKALKAWKDLDLYNEESRSP